MMYHEVRNVSSSTTHRALSNIWDSKQTKNFQIPFECFYIYKGRDEDDHMADRGHWSPQAWGKEGISCFLYMLMHCYVIHIAFE